MTDAESAPAQRPAGIITGEEILRRLDALEQRFENHHATIGRLERRLERLEQQRRRE